MSIEALLHIFIPTFNRERDLERTLGQILDVSSPVRNCAITVLDNSSCDSTVEVVERAMANHPNLSLVTHPHNIGGNANICRAMELLDMEYYWIMGDDDLYDFGNWTEVEKAIENGEKAICLSRYILPDDVKGDVAYQLVQATFISGMIIASSLVNDSVISEAYNNIHTLFPQMTPVISHLNNSGHIYVVDRPCVANGLLVLVDDAGGNCDKDVSYIRGSDENQVSPYSRFQRWIIGWSAVLAAIKDKSLRERALMAGGDIILNEGKRKGAGRAILRHIKSQMLGRKRLLPLAAYVYAVADRKLARRIRRKVLCKDPRRRKVVFYKICAALMPWRKAWYVNRIKRHSDEA